MSQLKGETRTLAASVVTNAFKAASIQRGEDPKGVRKAMKPLVAAWLTLCREVRAREPPPQ